MERLFRGAKMKLTLWLTLALLLAPTASAIGAVEATFLSQDPDPVEPGEYTELRWKLENVGSSDLENLVLELEPKFPFEFDREDDRVKKIPRLTYELQGIKSVTIKFRARINENALTGEELVKLHIRFADGAEKIEEQQIAIQSRELSLSVGKVHLLPERPEPGDQLTAEVTIRNTESVTAEDVNLKLALEGLPVAAVGETNEQFLKQLAGNQEHTFTFNLVVGADAKSQLYPVPLLVTYADKFGRNFNFSSSFGLAVEAPPEYIINVDKSDIVLPNTKGKVVLSVSNIGASDINYVTVEVKGTPDIEMLSNNLVYMGNLESDDYETAEFDLYVKDQTGNIDLPVTITYKDSYNRNIQDTKILTLKVYSKNDAIKYGLVTPSSSWGILLFLIIAGAGGYYWYTKRKK